MILTIWRHGEAAQASDDCLRELTPTGIKNIEHGAHRLSEICARKILPLPERLWHSRWQRTTQTAQLIKDQFTNISSCPENALIPGRTPAQLEPVLERIWYSPLRPEHLVLVSHQPLVSALADFLCGQRGVVPFMPPGGFATLSVDAPAAVGAGLLFWSFPPAYEAGV